MKSETLPNKPSRKSIATLVISFVVGITIGLLWYPGTVLINFGSPSDTYDQLQQSIGDNRIAITTIENYRAVLEPTTSIGTFIRILENISEKDVVILIEESISHSWNSQIATKQALLLGILAYTSPTRALDLAFNFPPYRISHLLKVIFEEWSRSNLDDAMAAASSLSPAFSEIAIEVILEQHDVLSSSDISTIAGEHNFLTSYLGRIQSEKANHLLDQPEKAFDLLVKDDVSDYLQREQFLQVLQLWKQKEGFNLIERVVNSNLSLILRQDLLGKITEQDRIGTLQYLNGLPAQKQTLHGSDIIRSWSSADGGGAFEVINSLHYFSSRASFIDIAIREWAKQNPREMIENIDSIPRKQRASGVAVAIRTLAETHPAIAVEEVQSLKSIPGAVDVIVEMTLVEEWTKNTPTKALAWVQENAELGTERRSHLLRAFLTEYTSLDPEKAMTIALAEKPTVADGLIGLERYVIRELVDRGNINTAIEFLPKLRAAARPMSYLLVGDGLLQDDQVDEAIQLAEQLVNDDKRTYYRQIVQTVSYSNSSLVFDILSKLPKSEHQQEVAQFLLNDSYLVNKFSEEQITKLKSYTSD